MQRLNNHCTSDKFVLTNKILRKVSSKIFVTVKDNCPKKRTGSRLSRIFTEVHIKSYIISVL